MKSYEFDLHATPKNRQRALRELRLGWCYHCTMTLCPYTKCLHICATRWMLAKLNYEITYIAVCNCQPIPVTPQEVREFADHLYYKLTKLVVEESQLHH